MRTITFAIILVLTACNSNSSNEEALAKVKGSYLYPSAILGSNYSAEDVAEISEGQINKWVNDEVWFSIAKEELSGINDIEKQVKAYERSLYISALKEKYLTTKPNNVSDEEIITYFKENKEKYTTIKNLYKMQMIIVGDQLSNIEDIKKALNSSSENQFIEEYCKSKRDDCILTPTWVDESFLATINLPNYLWKNQVKTEEYFLSDNQKLLYRIIESRNKGQLMPLEQVSQEIISILEFQKAKELLEKRQNELILNAQKNNEIELFK